MKNGCKCPRCCSNGHAMTCKQQKGSNVPPPNGNATGEPFQRSVLSRRKQARKQFIIKLSLEIIEELGKVSTQEIARLIDRRSCYSPMTGQIGQYLRIPLRNRIIRKRIISVHGREFPFYIWNSVK